VVPLGLAAVIFRAGRGRQRVQHRPHHLGAFRGEITVQHPGDDIVMHPWTAELVTRNAGADLGAEHKRALAMRYRRFERQL